MSKKVFINELKLKIRQSLIYMTLFLSVVWVLHDYVLYSRNVRNMKESLINDAKSNALEKIKEINVYTYYQKAKAESQQKKMLKSKTMEAHSLATNLYNHYKDTLSKEEIKKIIINSLQSIRWNNEQGYYFGITMNGVSKIHPKFHFNENILDLKDNEGKFLVKEMIDIARNKREGFLNYIWEIKPGSSIQSEKLTYIKYFEPFDWIFGTGNYLQQESKLIQEAVLDQFGYIGKLYEKEFLYMFDGNGPMIFSTAFPELIGKDYREIKDKKNHQIFVRLKENADFNSQEFVEYEWINPETSRSSRKLSIARKFDEWNWYIVSGFYLDDIEEKVRIQLKYIKFASLIKMLLSILVFIILAIVFNKIANIMIMKTLNDFGVFTRFIRNNTDSSGKMNPDELQYSEFADLAEDVNLMISKRQEAEEKLTNYKNDLELLVDRRTKELVDLNTQLNLENQERIRTASELEIQKQQFETIIQSAPSIIFGISPYGEVKYINPAGASISGYESTDVIDRNWNNIFFPDHKFRFPQDFLENNGFDHQLQNQLELVTKSGEKKNIIFSFRRLFDKDKQLKEIIFFGSDVTEILQAKNEISTSRKYIQNVIDSMPSGIISVNYDCTVSLWNQEISKSSGISPSDAEGKHITTVLPWLKNICASINTAIKNRSIQEETRVPYSDNNSSFYLNITVYPLLSGDTSGAVIRIDDVTEKVKMEELMIQSEKMLSIGGLAAGMAHEINNPLAGMIQNADVIHNRLSSGLKKNYKTAEELGTDFDLILKYMEKRRIPDLLSNVKKSGLIAAKIVDNMLSFARDNKARIKKENIAALLDKTIDLASNDYNMRKKYDFKKIEIHKEYSSDIPDINCEGSKIQQVILNLLRNSAHALTKSDIAKDRIPKIFVRAFKDMGSLRIEVEDNGPGISDKHQKHIFEPFFTLKTVGEGTGLGLSVSYFIITENHSGSMFVESELNKYTKFVIILPY